MGKHVGGVEMSKFNPGIIIKEYRIAKNVTQEKLCDGICSVSTLHRIENGKNEPSVFVLSSLLERLGYEAGKYFLSASSLQEIFFSNTYSAIEAMIMNRKYDEANEAMERLENAESLLKRDSGVEIRQQMILVLKCSISQGNNENPTKLHEMIIGALALTIPDLEESKISEYMLCYNEISLLNMLATTYKRLGDEQKIIHILQDIKKSMDMYYSDEYEKSRGYALTLYNLTNALGLAGKHDKVLEICEIAIPCCVNNKRLYLLPHLKFNKGCALFYMGDKENSKHLIIEAIYALRNNEDFQDAEIRAQFAEREMGLSLPY